MLCLIRSKTGEELTPKFMKWVALTQKQLLKGSPPAERAFCRILDKLKSRMPKRWLGRLHYTRQKYFIVDPHVVFFGDFYFGNLKLLIEIDGTSHAGERAREKDEWRTKLISTWKARVTRIDNDTVTGGDFRDVERWLLTDAAKSCPESIGQDLLEDYSRVRKQNPHIYRREGTMTTYREVG